MVEYKCENCGKIWNHKSTYTNHLNRKTPCKKLDDVMSRKFELLMEKIAELEKEVKESKNVVNENNDVVKENRDEISKLKNTKIINSNNSNNNNNIDNKKIINVILPPLPFGKEDLSFIDDIQCKKILSRGFKSIPEFIKTVHFNKNKPEYHNVYMPNWRDKSKILVFDGEHWNLENRDDVLDDLKYKGIDYIQRKYDELDINDKKDASIIKKLKNFIETYDSDDKNDILNNDLQLIIYNYRDLVKKIKK